jgi:hypothetical protein
MNDGTVTLTSSGPPLCIHAVLQDGERAALLAALEELAFCFVEAGAADFPTDLHFHAEFQEIPAVSCPALVMTSMLPALNDLGAPLDRLERELRDAFEAIGRKGYSAAYLATIFRRIDPREKAADPALAQVRMERIRRLDFLAAELSHDFDLNIIDFDRAFAHIGGRALGTDYSVTGSAATDAARHVIISTLFAAGLDEFRWSELQTEARLIYDRRRLVADGAPLLSVSAETLNYVRSEDGRRSQTYDTSFSAPRRLSDLWQNLRNRRITLRETFLITLRATKRVLRRRIERARS